MLEGSLARKHDFERAVTRNARSPSCYKDGQCYNGDNAASDCCTGHVVDAPVTCAKGPLCDVCKKAAEFVEKKLSTRSCVEIVLEDAALCELMGLGPEDPMSDICAATVAALCP